MFKLLIFLIFIAFGTAYSKPPTIYQAEKALQTAISNPENLIYISETLHPLKFKIKDLQLKEISKDIIRAFAEPNDNFQFGISNEFGYEREAAYLELTSIVKYYSIQIGNINIQAQLDIDNKEIYEIQFRPYLKDRETLLFMKCNYSQPNELIEYSVSESIPERTGWETVSHKLLSNKKYMFKTSKMDKNGNEKDKKNAFKLGTKLQQILIALMEEHHKCEIPPFAMKIQKDSLENGINNEVIKFINERKTKSLYDGYLKLLQTQKIVLLYIKYFDGHGLYSKIQTKEGVNNFLSDELEPVILNVIEKYAGIDITQWKYCLPAKYKKTFLITLENGKVSKIEY